MKKLAVVAVMLVVASLPAQGPVRIFTRPTPPPREVLDKLDLVEMWRVHLLLDGERDGFRSVQLLRSPKGKATQLLAQTIRGDVYLLNAETGDVVWRTGVGPRYWASQAAAYNSQSIFVTRRDYLHVLDRASGRDLVYTRDKESKVVNYGYRMAEPPSAPPVADEEMIFLCQGRGVIAYHVPIFDPLKRKAAEFLEGEPAVDEYRSAQPTEMFFNPTPEVHSLYRPALNATQIAIVGTDGALLSLSRFAPSVRFQFNALGPVDAPLGIYDDTLFMGSEDQTLYAINSSNGKMEWRFLASGRILKRPAANEKDVFVTSTGQGMFRLDRKTGLAQWRNDEASDLVSVNPRFVYAVDRTGALLVLDGDRGISLAKYDTREWNLPVTNEINDRLYFAAHDGQIIGLRHRQYTQPAFVLPFEEDKVPVKKVGKGKDAGKDKDKVIDKEKEPEKGMDEPAKDKDKELDKEPAKEKETPKVGAADAMPIQVGSRERLAWRREERGPFVWTATELHISK